MEADSWGRFSSASSKRHQSTLRAKYDAYLGFGESDGAEDEAKPVEYPCPFCSEDFDIVGLCCHIDDEHPVEARNGVCPVCAARVGMDLVGHMTVEHESFFKMQHKRRLHKGSPGTLSTLSLLRKDLHEGNLQSLFGGSSYTLPLSNTAPDPLLSSFILNIPLADPSEDVLDKSPEEENMTETMSDEKLVESVELSLSEKDHEERVRRSEFAGGLLLSTIFEDTL